MNTISSAAHSEGENVSEIETLVERVRVLGQSVDWWNNKMVWSLGLVAIAAVFVVFTTVMALKRAGQKDDAQSELLGAKDRQLAVDLRDKDVKIAGANLARVKIEESIAWRRLTPQQQSEIGSALRVFGTHSASLWYGGAQDKEAETFALEIASALHGAHWKVFRPAVLLIMPGSGIPFDPAMTGSDTGVSVSGPNTDEGRKIVTAIVAELTSRGFDASSSRDPRRPPLPPDGTDFKIEVNVRPQGPQGEAKLHPPQATAAP
jgi:hypothetical protein